MSDLLTQLHAYGQQIESEIGAPAGRAVVVSDPVATPLPPRGSRPWVWALSAAAIVALLFLPFLFDRPTSTVVGEPPSPVTVAESFMNAWVAGDDEAAAALFSARATLDRLEEPGMLPALLDWYRAVGQEFQNQGCKIQLLGAVECTYTIQNDLGRAMGREPATGSFVLSVDGGTIDSASGLLSPPISEPGSGGVDDMFKAWVLINHPEGYEHMYSGADWHQNSSAGPRFDSTSIELWERYTDELTASPGAVTQLLSEWAREAEARAAYFAQAQGICREASGRYRAAEAEIGVTYGATPQDLPKTADVLPEIAESNEAAARISEEALTEMRALPSPPETARGLFNMFYSLADQQVDLHRQIATAASAGDTARVETLLRERVDMTHQIDGLLMSCPVRLPA